ARRPRAHARSGTWLHQVDRRHTAEVVSFAVTREIPLVRPPAHLARLRALADKAVDRPRVDELADALGHVGGLRIALGDVDDFHPEALRKLAPVRARAGITGVHLD